MVKRTDTQTLRTFVKGHTKETAEICTNDARADLSIDKPQGAANNSVSKCVNDMRVLLHGYRFWERFDLVWCNQRAPCPISAEIGSNLERI